jgi:hypothetical protein
LFSGFDIANAPEGKGNQARFRAVQSRGWGVYRRGMTVNTPFIAIQCPGKEHRNG